MRISENRGNLWIWPVAQIRFMNFSLRFLVSFPLHLYVPELCSAWPRAAVAPQRSLPPKAIRQTSLSSSGTLNPKKNEVKNVQILTFDEYYPRFSSPASHCRGSDFCYQNSFKFHFGTVAAHSMFHALKLSRRTGFLKEI